MSTSQPTYSAPNKAYLGKLQETSSKKMREQEMIGVAQEGSGTNRTQNKTKFRMLL